LKKKELLSKLNLQESQKITQKLFVENEGNSMFHSHCLLFAKAMHPDEHARGVK
jgi:hypothetical protein